MHMLFVLKFCNVTFCAIINITETNYNTNLLFNDIQFKDNKIDVISKKNREFSTTKNQLKKINKRNLQNRNNQIIVEEPSLSLSVQFLEEDPLNDPELRFAISQIKESNKYELLEAMDIVDIAIKVLPKYTNFTYHMLINPTEEEKVIIKKIVKILKLKSKIFESILLIKEIDDKIKIFLKNQNTSTNIENSQFEYNELILKKKRQK
ncbi:hypothetical protein GVAV_002160 [Gurleya vavrai]